MESPEKKTKYCGYCQKYLPVSEFDRNITRRYGYQMNCRKCTMAVFERRAKAKGRAGG